MATRPNGVLKYDPSILNKTHGTIAVWFKLHNLNADYCNALITTSTALFPGPRLLIMREFEGSAANKLRVWDGDGSTEDALTSTTVLQKDVWYHFAFTWSPSGRRLYINGSLEASNARSGPIGGSELRIGYWRDGRDFLNGLLDELLILPYAASVEEIRSWYEAQAPFYDPDGFWHAGNFDPASKANASHTHAWADITSGVPSLVNSVTAGTGISVSGSTGNITITNSDPGSSQSIFKNIGDGTAVKFSAGSNNDTLHIVAGSNIALTWDTTNKKVTIAVPGFPWSGLTGVPATFPPSAHKATHASGGSDPLTPADIGAVNKAGDTMSGSLTLSAGSLYLPSTGYAGAGQIQCAGTVRIANGTAAQEMYVKQIAVTDSWADADANKQTNGIYSKGVIKSGVPAGTAPFIVNSTTTVTNLSADLLDGQHGDWYRDWANLLNKPASFPPSAHAASHHSGGADALNLGSIAGTLTDTQHGNRGGGSLHTVATTTSAGFMSAADKSKLDGIQAGAEVNQFAFSNVKVGSTTIAADTKTDTLELVAGANVALTPDATNDRVTIAVPSFPWSGLTDVPATFPPSAHAASHHAGGADALTLSSITGTITPVQHGNQPGGSLHNLVSDVEPGFISVADWQKLMRIPRRMLYAFDETESSCYGTTESVLRQHYLVVDPQYAIPISGLFLILLAKVTGGIGTFYLKIDNTTYITLTTSSTTYVLLTGAAASIFSTGYHTVTLTAKNSGRYYCYLALYELYVQE